MSRFFIFLLLGFFIVNFFASPAMAGGNGMGAEVELKISVRIIDYPTTVALCGSFNPPGWCPAHLLRQDDGINVSENDIPEVFDGEPAGFLTKEEQAQRDRIAAVKARLAQESPGKTNQAF